MFTFILGFAIGFGAACVPVARDAVLNRVKHVVNLFKNDKPDQEQ
jgi:hypothetical protein